MAVAVQRSARKAELEVKKDDRSNYYYMLHIWYDEFIESIRYEDEDIANMAFDRVLEQANLINLTPIKK